MTRLENQHKALVSSDHGEIDRGDSAYMVVTSAGPVDRGYR